MFKRTFQLLLVACLPTGPLRAANDPFVGDWKLNQSRSKLTDQMKVQSIAGNKYAFDFGDGSAETIAVDRTDQPGKKEGRILLTATWKLSKDGNTLTDDFTAIQPNGSPFNLKYVYKRMAGTSGFAGTWESTSETVNSVFVLQVRPYEGDGLSFIDPSQEETKNMKFDGKDYPTVGPNVASGSASSVRRVNQNTSCTALNFCRAMAASSPGCGS
jgi:hypothetical protein